ncbi:TlpA family protein disulfide reductase [Actinoplanes sp. NPDC051859]|uniref:TlpA family protein disulfide reductase n=1 Tax=Actinoplanes sp. NPDC051859 TaxID=3363909 RepID=UPI0037ADF150
MFVPVLLCAVSALLVLNLVLTYGALRRLREHAQLLNPDQGPAIKAAGETVSDFAASTVDAATLTAADLGAGTLIGFFTPGCEPCREMLPKFARVAAAHAAGRTGVVAVLVGDEETTADDARMLASVAQVVVASRAAPIVAAFAVQAYPSICTMGDRGRIAALGLPAAEPVHVGAAA